MRRCLGGAWGSALPSRPGRAAVRAVKQTRAVLIPARRANPRSGSAGRLWRRGCLWITGSAAQDSEKLLMLPSRLKHPSEDREQAGSGEGTYPLRGLREHPATRERIQNCQDDQNLHHNDTLPALHCSGEAA